MKKIILLVACFAITTLQAQKSSVSAQDQEFADYAIMASLMELKLSQMAVNKGFSPAVKELAQHMLEDNKKADALLSQLAKDRSIPVATELDEEHQKEYNKLSDKVGEDFDMTYAECMVKDHKKAIDVYEKQSKKGENTELRAFAINVLPNLNHHKTLANETCKKLKKK